MTVKEGIVKTGQLLLKFSLLACRIRCAGP